MLNYRLCLNLCLLQSLRLRELRVATAASTGKTDPEFVCGTYCTPA